MKLMFKCKQDQDPAADCEDEWFCSAKWVDQRWGLLETQNDVFFFLGFCYLSWGWSRTWLLIKRMGGG